MNIDKNSKVYSLGEAHTKDVCEDCQIKIEKYMEKQGKLFLLRPLHHAKKLQSMVCRQCKVNVLKNMKGKL